MIHAKEKALLHIYADAAGLNDATYRSYLRSAAGVDSAASPSFTQAGFEAAMASLETVLFQRVEAGEVPDPRGRSRYIQEEFYWRKKLPRKGGITTRQAHQIESLWSQLCQFLPEDARSSDYQARIVARATGQSADHASGTSLLRAHEAANLIDALTDRLSHAIKAARAAEVAQAALEAVPF